MYEEKDLELLEAVLGAAAAPCSVHVDAGGAPSTSPHAADEGDAAGGPPPQPRVFVHSTIEMGAPRQPQVASASTAPGALVAGEFVFFLCTLVQVRAKPRLRECAREGGLRPAGLHVARKGHSRRVHRPPCRC